MIGSIIGGAASLGSAIYGAVASSKANNKARQLLSDQKQKNEDWYNTKMSEDYTKRSDAQAVISKQRELLNEQYRNAKATNIVAGGTDESLALQKESANKALAQTMSDIASQASDYKDNIEQQYRSQDAALAQQQAQNYAAQGAAAAQAAGQAVNAGVSLMGNDISEMSKAKAVKAAAKVNA